MGNVGFRRGVAVALSLSALASGKEASTTSVAPTNITQTNIAQTNIAAVTPTPTQPAATQPAAPPPADTPDHFDAATTAFGNVFSLRDTLIQHGIQINPSAIIDDSVNTHGGVDTNGNSIRERFNIPIDIDTEKLFGLAGGSFYTVYQIQHGGNASHTLTGDAQNFAFGTDADGRTQLGQLYYQQVAGPLRIRAGKLDGNADFDTLDNGVEFLNNSFSTTPCLALLPSFPDTGTGIELFIEPTGTDHGVYLGGGVYDGSAARGIRTGEYGPRYFLNHGDNLFLITEAGYRYELHDGKTKLPGKIAAGGWFDTNPFPDVAGTGRTTGTGGAYATFDQILWKPRRSRPISAGNVIAAESGEPSPNDVEEFPGGVALTSSVSWADPLANRVDGNLLGGVTWTGAIPTRKIDVLGAGATVAHFGGSAAVRDAAETAIEAFYRIRFTQWVSLKPDIQYIIHPGGAGEFNETVRRDALVLTLRLEMSF